MANGFGLGQVPRQGQRVVSGFLSGLLNGVMQGIQLRRQREQDAAVVKQQNLENKLRFQREEREKARFDFDRRAAVEAEEEKALGRVEAAKQRIAGPIRQEIFGKDAAVLEREKAQLERQLPGIPELTGGERTAAAQERGRINVLREARELGVTTTGRGVAPTEKFKTPEETRKERVAGRVIMRKETEEILKQTDFGGRLISSLPPAVVDQAVRNAARLETTPEQELPDVLGTLWADNLSVSHEHRFRGLSIDQRTPFMTPLFINELFGDGTVEDNFLRSIEDLAVIFAENPDNDESEFVLEMETIFDQIETPFAPFKAGFEKEKRKRQTEMIFRGVSGEQLQAERQARTREVQAD